MMNICVCYSLLLATLGIPPSAPPAVAAREQSVLVLSHAVIVDGNGGAPIEDGTVVIRGSRIEAVGPSQTLAVSSDAKVIDARRKTAMPGLADMHVHLAGGWDGETTDLLGYRRYLNALLYAGVTEWGTLEPGKLANILLVTGRPARNVGETRHVARVIREGKLVDREMLKFDVSTDPGFRTSAPVSANP